MISNDTANVCRTSLLQYIMTLKHYRRMKRLLHNFNWIPLFLAEVYDQQNYHYGEYCTSN